MRFETLHPTKNAQLRLERRRKRVVFLNTQEIGNNIYGPWQWQYIQGSQSPPDPKNINTLEEQDPYFAPLGKLFCIIVKKPKRGSAADFMSPKAA